MLRLYLLRSTRRAPDIVYNPSAKRMSVVALAGQEQHYQVVAHCSSPLHLATAKTALEQRELCLGGSDQAGHVSVLFATDGLSQQPADPSRHSDQFDVPAYFEALHTENLGRVLLSAAELPSTQTLLQNNLHDMPDGTVCFAAKQVAGKGRGKNMWESPAGCLMFSLFKKLSLPGDRLPFLQYVVSLAAVQAVQTAARHRLQGSSINFRIKWPNDLYHNGLKIGGVLCHSVYRDGKFFTVSGVGLNLTNSVPTTCVQAIVEQQRQQQGLPAQQPLTSEELLAGILNRLEGLLTILEQEGFGPLRQEYLSNWLHTGQQVTLEEEVSGSLRQVPLTIQGLTQSGYLQAADAFGQVYELHPDGNSLDFFKGLVRKKVR